ncbi:MAG TPA: ATP-binding protein [Coleofasciculaceae cyanobacterium]
MSSYSSSLGFKKIVNHQVWQQLVDLWLTMGADNETFLFTEDTLFKLLENGHKIDASPQLKTDKFFLLITPKFNALLRQHKTIAVETYQVSVIFDRAAIINQLTQLGCQQKWHTAVINRLQSKFMLKLTKNNDSDSEFMVKAVKLLTDSAEQSDRQYGSHHTPPMEKLFHYQIEQERIFEQIKIQISQNLNLSEIIQTTVNHSCSFLELDRLLVYQLDVSLESNYQQLQPVYTVDTITYEAKKSDNITSTLYLQEEACWRDSFQCRDKYHQGFNLVINDLDASNLTPCLKSLMAKLQVKAKVVIPINVKDKLWGLVIAHQCFEPRQWQHQEVHFLRQVAEYLAIAIFNHQSYQQLQQQKLLLEKQVQIQAHQIRDALIAAEAASKSKHDFLGSMSHELRTPLTCVIGLSSTLLQWSSTNERIPLSPEKQHKYLHLIQQSGKHLLALINNILEFSDVESGKHLLNIKQVSLTDVVKQSMQLLQESAEEKKITFSSQIKIEPEQDYFFADETRLKEILFHILNNGIKFTPEAGEVTLRIWREKRQVVFQIEDTGIGIAAAEIPLLFEKFKQIENFRQRVHGGTGLGLALTKKLVELHGGTIEVESAEGKGSIFTIYLPEKNFTKLELSQPAISAQASVESKTIMLITEDEESATFICQLLNTIEYQVVWLMDYAMAINQIELLQPRIVIIERDCSLADVKNVVSAINRTPLTHVTNVALLCDRFEHHEWQKFVECGVNEYLLKSMNPTQIINKIARLTKKDNLYN